jgi:hemoglobin-like flavoprotein
MSSDLDFEAVAHAFYTALFREAPDVERLFRDETNKTVMFVNALESISDMERGDPHLGDFMAMLGRRHRDIGITQQHVKAGWNAFNEALEESGGNMTLPRRQFYRETFKKLVAAMQYDPNDLT